MNKLKIYAAFCLLTSATFVTGLELHKGVVQEFNTVLSAEQRTALPVITQAVRTQATSEQTGASIGFVKLEGSNHWYRLYRNLHLYGVDVSTTQLLGGGPLDPYPSHLYLSAEYTATQEKASAVRGDSFSRPTDPLTVVSDRSPGYFLSPNSKDREAVGCFEMTPLRYGDINGNGTPEIVLFLGKKMIVFSTVLNEVIFSAHYWEDDELTAKEANDFVSEFKPSHPYFVAGSGTDILVEEIFPAWRSLSKLYFDDFNNDQKHDIVIWRKVYTSKMRMEPEAGFNKTAEKLVHYSFQDGRYQLQATTSDVIKSWLTTKQLTWQKGFPSKSECPGQEGQLIPEMHDALLNDPEVLM